MPEYEQWEYIAFVDNLVPDANGTEDRLNKMGLQGWNLVSVVSYRPVTPKGMVAPSSPLAVFYMKRSCLQQNFEGEDTQPWVTQDCP